ncbi:MFS transporter [Chryseolinea sp. H1M3-3]|uniref:MFS transporter n=1 Tax=Chryseolinea sp. H1M3-3 TaxID=3034144 RepID=UPI0023EC76C2|nr:MFS transporter [Chryseolinea sp. H1M3-3]
MKGKQRTRAIFLSACLGMLLFGMSLITLGSVATGLQSKFMLDSISFGMIVSILPFGILSGSLLFGPFADRYGYKIIMTSAGLSMFAGFQGIAYSTDLAVLKMCVFLFGLGGGAINGATNAVVSDISQTNKSANLSVLGVFFAIGALGMPFVLAVLQKEFSFEIIVSSVGYLALLAAALFVVTRFPVAKQTCGISFFEVLKLLRDDVLILVGFFLFCQSSFEAIINNWTTTFLLEKNSISISEALYALSMYVVGMAVMRIILGNVLKHVSSRTVLLYSIVLLGIGCSLLTASSYPLSILGLVVLGAGLAAGFPVTLGFVGERYETVSGTAFSIVISIGLIGSMAVNYLMGFIVDKYGIAHLVTMGFLLTTFMLLFSLLIIKKLNLK